MRVAGVMGWPVAHSKSPLIHRFWLGALGIDGDYVRLPVRPEDFAGAVRALPLLGFAGVNVTVPHKAAALACADTASAAARGVGAANILCAEADGRLHADNSDVAGFLEPLGDWRGGTAALVGAGGAARAVLFALRSRGVTRVVLINRTEARARALLAEFGLAGEVLPLGARVPAVDLLVNASSLGMVGQPALPLDLSGLPGDALVYDLVYAPLETGLLAAARGLRVIDGLHMLIGQAAVAFRYFYDADAPRHLDGTLRQILAGAGSAAPCPPEA